MLDRLVEDWTSGANRFDRPGEIYLGHSLDGELRAVGGVNRDDYEGGAECGRLRHFFVHPHYRRERFGSGLLSILVVCARLHFPALRLRTRNPAAARFYEAAGFAAVDEPFATHRLRLGD